MAQHEVLGKILAALQAGPRLGRTDDGDVARGFVGLEGIVNALHQRVFGTYDHHLHVVVEGELLQCREIRGLQGDILPHLARTGIARRDIQFVHMVALGYFPRQCVFAAARAE